MTSEEIKEQGYYWHKGYETKWVGGKEQWVWGEWEIVFVEHTEDKYDMYVEFEREWVVWHSKCDYSYALRDSNKYYEKSIFEGPIKRIINDTESEG